MASNYSRGVRMEYRCMRMLDKVGYTCFRTAGSHGVADVIAVGPTDTRLIQVKRGRSPFSEADREVFRLLPVGPAVVKELWRFAAARQAPEIERL